MTPIKKTKKIPKKVSKFINDKFYDFKDEKTGKKYEFKKGLTPQDAGYLKKQDDIGSLEDFKNDFSDIFEDFFKDYKPVRTQPLKNIFDDLFEDEQKALKTIQSWKPISNSAQTIKKISENTQSLTNKAQREQHNKATDMGGGRRRKQILKQSKLVPLVPRFKPREKSKIAKDGSTHWIVGEGDKLLEYLYKHELKSPFDLIKAHGKHKKKLNLENDDWATLADILRSINMTPQEVLDYCVGSVQTKKRFLELRLYREYETNSKLAINNFIKLYRNHLKTKQPLKVFAVSKPFKNWCIEEDLYFNSDENLRQNIKLMIVSWNKDNPKDKIPLKIK